MFQVKLLADGAALCDSQAFHFLHNTAVKFLEAIATPSRLDVQAFPRLHNDPLLQPERSCACALSIIQTCDPSQAQSFKSHKAEGLLTLIFIDQPAGLQVDIPRAFPLCQFLPFLPYNPACVPASLLLLPWPVFS